MQQCTCVPAHARGDDAQEEWLVGVICREGALHQNVVLIMKGSQNLQHTHIAELRQRHLFW